MDSIHELGIADVGRRSRRVQRSIPSSDDAVSLIVASFIVGVISIITCFRANDKSISSDWSADA
jgi:hypothetical protein